MNIELNIEELLLEGFDPRDRYRIADELERALTGLLRESQRPKLQHDERAERVDAGSIVLPKDSPPRVVGSQVAGAIMHALHGQGGDRNRR